MSTANQREFASSHLSRTADLVRTTLLLLLARKWSIADVLVIRIPLGLVSTCLRVRCLVKKAPKEREGSLVVIKRFLITTCI